MRYLSDEWIDAANTAVAALEPSLEPFAVTYTVTGGPDGDRTYTLDLATPSVQTGGAAPVGLRMTWEVAVGIARGAVSAQRAFLDGDMQIAGNAQALVGNADGMAAVDTALTELRSKTDY